MQVATSERHNKAVPKQQSNNPPSIHLAKPIPESGRRLAFTEVIQIENLGIRAAVSDSWIIFRHGDEHASLRWRDKRSGEGATWKLGIAPTEVPNLDAMEHEDLMRFWQRHQDGRNRHFLLSKGNGSRKIVADLARYAANLATAMRCRLDGNIQNAMKYEAICESIYNKLPEAARW